jgi:hypothetical protein
MSSSREMSLREDRLERLIYPVLEDCPVVNPEAQAPKSDHHAHHGAPTHGGRFGGILKKGVEANTAL